MANQWSHLVANDTTMSHASHRRLFRHTHINQRISALLHGARHTLQEAIGMWVVKIR